MFMQSVNSPATLLWSKEEIRGGRQSNLPDCWADLNALPEIACIAQEQVALICQ